MMLAIGGWLGLLTFSGLILLWRNSLYSNQLFLKAAFFSIPLPFICNELGWFAAEIGRQPWIVYNILRTSDGTSITVSTGEILFSIIMFTLVYSLLFGLWIFLLKRKVEQGPQITA